MWIMLIGWIVLSLAAHAGCGLYEVRDGQRVVKAFSLRRLLGTALFVGLAVLWGCGSAWLLGR